MTLITLLTYFGIGAIVLTLFLTQVLKVHKSMYMTFLQSFTGIWFIFSGWVKAVDPMGTAFKMVDYFTEFEATFKDTAMSFIAPIFPFLSEYALPFAIIMIIFEIILGLMLLIGDRPKLTSWLFFFLMIFFTALTGFTYLTGFVPMDKNFFSFGEWTTYVKSNMRVTDCGCFGDFIKLDPRISFYKDVFLMVPAVYFLFRYEDMHQLFTQKARNTILLATTGFLLLYCVYNFYWNEPHVDFRPFKNGANIAAIQAAEKDAAANVQVLAMKMKNKKTGEVKEIPYAEYMKNVAALTEDYETLEQIKTEPIIAATKISDFSITDFDGKEKSEIYLANPKLHIMVPIYKAPYTAKSRMVTIQDSIFVFDTIKVANKSDSIKITKTLQSVQPKEEKVYDIIWDADFVQVMKDDIKPLADAASKDKVQMSIVISGIDQDKASSLAKETGITAEYLTGDEKLIKTIMRSNPGIIFWKNGVLLHKWHYKKFPGYEAAKAEFK
jgi:uncharacterized membrane protein YphA (DoxX/SURF4 family)